MFVGLLISGAATVAALMAIMILVPRIASWRRRRMAAERLDKKRISRGLRMLREAEYSPELRKLPSGRVSAR